MNVQWLCLGALPLALISCRTTSAQSSGNGSSDGLVGTWKLVSYTRTALATNEATDLFGKSPSGYITYGADGHVQIILVKEDRPKPDLKSLTDADRADLFKTMVAYAGTYTFDGKTVTHHIQVSWNQAWTGTDLLRDVQIEGNRLTLTTHPAPNPIDGVMSVSRVVWDRAAPFGR